jgi:cellulose synthase/poly-beta-1,6-N-acetylglucosamine synthase-like glycosyltransferase
VIIAAFNEEKDIGRKLEEVLALDYPSQDRQIIVASDKSTDRTHEIVHQFVSRGVELVVLPTRAGKTAAQNLAVAQARGEILVFTDATTSLAPDALRKLVEPFGDSRVGCAGGRVEYQLPDDSAIGRGCGQYWRYESLMRLLESQVNSPIGVSGAIYAVRRGLYAPMDPGLISDFVIALDVFSRGHRCVYVPEAVAYERTHERADIEFTMRCRIVVRTIHALVQRAALLNPFRAGFFAVQLWSHKIFRYLVPELLVAVLVLCLTLSVQGGPRAEFYQGLVAIQLVLYIGVPTAYVLCRCFNIATRALSAPFYFMLANAAALWGLVSYLRGVREVTWTTVR